MEVEVIFKKENPLMDRLEVDFKVSHPKEVTPKRKDVRNEIATLLKVQKDRIVIDHMKSEFGKPETLGYAKVYKSKSEALSKETEAVLKRNSLVEEKKEKAEEKKEKAETKKETAEEKTEEE
jgi:small subunit ribosomal protein S24e